MLCEGRLLGGGHEGEGGEGVAGPVEAQAAVQLIARISFLSKNLLWHRLNVKAVLKCSAQVRVCVVMLPLTTLVSNGSWKLECAPQGGEVMAVRPVGTECGALGGR